MKIIIVFFCLSIINVVFSTIRQITTIKSGKLIASLISGGYFAYYNIILLYTVSDFPMWQKCIVTFICNVIGVYIVKYTEEKARKDKLWEIRATVSGEDTLEVHLRLKNKGIPHNYIENVGKYTVFNCYSATQDESLVVKEILNRYHAKYFVSETKELQQCM